MIAAPFTTAETVIVVAGFAANMTGTVEAVAFGEVLGWRVQVFLPGYGLRWLPADYLRPVEG